MIIGVVFIVIVFIIAIWFVGAYNGLVRLRNEVKNAWAQIDVQLKRRHDLIPNLVEVVKDYMGYESEVLQKVVEARSAAVRAQGPAEASAAEGQLSQALQGLYVVMESYPQLRANENVGQLQEELTSTENKIAFARQYYNDTVTRFNTRTEVIPTSIIAGMCGFKREDLFEIPEAEKEVPKVDLR
jgi:LemA protein